MKFSKSFGAHATALSRSEEKHKEALAAGADAFNACLGNTDKNDGLGRKFNLLIDTCCVNTGVGAFRNMLKFNRIYCHVGIPP